MKQYSLGLLGLATTCGLVGCGGSGTLFQTSSVQNVETLKNGFVYEGWAIVDGAPKTFGRFNVDSSGQLVSTSGAPMPGFKLPTELAKATKLIITIEPAVDPDPGPSTTHFIAGNVVAGEAVLTTTDGAALGTDFTAATGSFLFATPTQQPKGANPLSGVWFMSGPGMAGLSLPTLPAGWQYEGWAVVSGRPLSTGKFLTGSGADSAGTFSGPNAGPPFPGEDFLVNAPSGLTFPTNLSPGPIVVSIEPSPDDDPAPFSFKPLIATPPAGIAGGVVVNMNNQSATTAPRMTIRVN
jgi:hypothetical protein